MFYDVRYGLQTENERDNESSVMRVGNHLDDTGSDAAILEGNYVADMAIEGESNDRIGCRVLWRWNDCGCSDLWRYFGWGDKFGSGRIGGRRMEFGVEGHLSDIESGIHELVGRISG